MSLPVLAGALWLGLLTSLSPCPVTTNVVALTFLARDVENPRAVLAAGALYTVGRAAAYTLLAGIIVKGLLSIPSVSNFLQQNLNKVLGPVLIVAGVLLLDLVSLPTCSGGLLQAVQQRAAGLGLAAAGVLGFLFALAFCPVSAALFFGSLIPLSLKESPHLLPPVLYGMGTALPVIVVAFGMAVGARAVGEWLQRIGKVEAVARTLTGLAFVAVGIYYVLAHILEVV